jgi:WD40 repeat protein
LLQGSGVGASADPGDQLWVRRYDRSKNYDVARAIGVSPDGLTVFVTGRSTDRFGFADFGTLAYDAASGAKRWMRNFDSGNGQGDIANALAVSPDGRTVFVAGQAQGFSPNAHYGTLAYDAATGAQLWFKLYVGPAEDWEVAHALAVSPDGTTVFVTGESTGSSGNLDYATVAYDAATGAQVWVMRYNGPANSNDIAREIALSPDGSTVFVAGSSHAGSPTWKDYAIIAYDAASGNQLWVKRYNGPGSDSDYATALAVSPDGQTVFVSGASQRAHGRNHDYATVAYDAANGTQLWVSRYDGPANNQDIARALAVSRNGTQVFVTGKSFAGPDGGSYDYATVAYDALDGTQLWVSRYNGPGNRKDGAPSLAVAPGGSWIYVTGWSWAASSGYDYATIAYAAANGAQRWVRRYKDPEGSADFANALAVNPDGSRIFVTGRRLVSAEGGDWDYTTVAYSTR